MRRACFLSALGSLVVIFAFYGIIREMLKASDVTRRAGLSFNVNQTILQHSGDVVTLSWSSIPSPTIQDWVGLWSADNSTLFAWFYPFDQPTYHRAQSKWPQLYPGKGRWLRQASAPPDLPAPVDDILDFQNDIATGSGSASFRLYNFRLSGYVFMYYREGSPLPSDAPVFASEPVAFAQGLEEPTQPRIALTNNPNDIRLVWVSGLPDSSGKPSVLFGPSANHLPYTAFGSSHTFDSSALCHQPIVDWGWISPGYIHDVVISPVTASGGVLQAGDRVYYTMGANGVYSKTVRWFIVPSTPGSNSSADFTWIMYADMGTETEFGCLQCRIQMKGSRGMGVTPLINAILSNELASNSPPAFIAHVGDLSYARGMAWKWDIFFNTIQPLSGYIPYMIENGNHEYDHQAGGVGKDPSGDFGDAGYRPLWGNFGRDSHGECGVHLYHRFHMPDNGNSVFWYSFLSHNLWAIVLSAEHSLETGSQQRVWLEQQLMGVDRSAFPWLVVAIHRPLYMSEYENRMGALYRNVMRFVRYQPDGSDYNVSIALRGIIGDLLQQYSVDLVLAGHYHSYERTCPVYREECLTGPDGSIGGTVHAVVGTAGIGYDSPQWLPVSWAVSHFPSVYAYARIHVMGRTELRWQLIDANTNSVLDDTIIRSNHSFVYNP